MAGHCFSDHLRSDPAHLRETRWHVGRKNLFLFCTIIFILGSALCGWSSNMDMLTWSRAVQGIGAGGIYGQTSMSLLVIVIIADLVDLQDAGKYLSVAAAIWGIAYVAGPLLGGAFSQDRNHLPGSRLVLGSNTWPWRSGHAIGTMVGGGVMLFIAAERFAKFPHVALSMFKGQTLIAIFRAELFHGMVLLGRDHEGLLLSAEVAVKPAEIGVVTGLFIFVQYVGNAFGIALFAAAYVNRLSESLAQLDREVQGVAHVLTDVQDIRSLFSPDVVERIVDVYANSMQNGWWLLFLPCTAG
ncbi:hypothetical protein DL762_002173 [Monosporascus cannonballus]|uniref:Major facilitator superfamily (MFS) profile domain-containing protein n=1 Tax=Monosporascus cannonballus TaxID=155416 RepID=A0ABY0HGQ5_9PEZI|nr:hypothetical protein DL762_002173 [Monosporascus cannonballus]